MIHIQISNTEKKCIEAATAVIEFDGYKINGIALGRSRFLDAIRKMTVNPRIPNGAKRQVSVFECHSRVVVDAIRIFMTKLPEETKTQLEKDYLDKVNGKLHSSRFPDGGRPRSNFVMWLYGYAPEVYNKYWPESYAEAEKAYIEHRRETRKNPGRSKKLLSSSSVADRAEEDEDDEEEYVINNNTTNDNNK